jgi:transposase
MFWACFKGGMKGPCLVWDPAWGTMTSQTYIRHIVPLITEFYNANPGSVFMQDNVPCHRARATVQELNHHGVYPCVWPPFSPDLNPIEHVWNWMKDYMERHYPERMTRPQLKQAILDSWEAVPTG